MLMKVVVLPISFPAVIYFSVIGALLATELGGPSGFALGWLAVVAGVYSYLITDKFVPKNFVADKIAQGKQYLQNLLKVSGDFGSCRQIACDCLRVGLQGAVIGAVCGFLGTVVGAQVCCLGWMAHYLKKYEDEMGER